MDTDPVVTNLASSDGIEVCKIVLNLMYKAKFVSI